MKQCSILLLLLCMALTGVAQDIHFSQFNEAPLSLNPANTGHFEGDWRISNIYRRQWAGLGDPFVTAAIGYDQPLSVYGQNLGVGGYVFNDRSGVIGLNVFKAAIGGAIHRKIGRHRLRGGLQVGYVAKSFDLGAATFPDQFEFNAGAFNPALSSAGSAIGQQSRFVDMAAGLGWQRKLRGWTPDVGVAFHHINGPTDSFFENNEPLPMRTTIHGTATIDLTKKVYLWPRLIYQTQRKAAQSLAGLFAGYKLPQNKINLKSIYAGPVLRTGINRNADALALVAGLRFKNLQVGMGYDYTVSNLGPAVSSQGALELSLIYIPNPVVNRITVPCDRY